MRKYFFTIVLSLYSVCSYTAESNFSIPLRNRGGVYEVMATLNSELKVYFIVDSGASDVTISESVAELLAKNESLERADIKGDAQYEIADGNKATGKIINIKSIDIGGHKIFNVKAVVLKGAKVPLLLGQSALRQLGSWTINSSKNRLDFKVNSNFSAENKSFDTSQNSKIISKPIQLLCTGEISKTKDTVPIGKENITVNLQVDLDKQVINTTDSWGCLANVGLVGTNEKLTNICVGNLPVDINEKEFSYYKKTSGDLYTGTGMFSINRSSGLMSVNSMATAKSNPNWVIYIIEGKLQCKKSEQQF